MSQLDGVRDVVASGQIAPARASSPLARVAVPVLAVLAVAAQCYGLYRPAGPAEPALFAGADKVEHLLGFAVPVALVLLSRPGRREAERVTMPRRSTVAVLMAFVLQAVASEAVQGAYYRRRDGDVADVLADLTGIALGWLIFQWVRRRADRRRRAGRPQLARP